MKLSNLDNFLTDCRSAKTSGEIALVVDQIETKIGTMRDERATFAGQLQKAIIAGNDVGKIHAAIAQTDQDLMTLQAALAGFSQRQADVRKHEEGNATQALISKHRLESQELEVATKEFAAAMEKARASGARVAGLAKQQERTAVELEALGQRRLTRASGIIRETIGEVRRGHGISEYGRRVDIGLAEVLSDNPSIMRRAQVMRRGRVGETNLAKDLATEGWMKLASGQ